MVGGRKEKSERVEKSEDRAAHSLGATLERDRIMALSQLIQEDDVARDNDKLGRNDRLSRYLKRAESTTG